MQILPSKSSRRQSGTKPCPKSSLFVKVQKLDAAMEKEKLSSPSSDLEDHATILESNRIIVEVGLGLILKVPGAISLVLASPTSELPPAVALLCLPGGLLAPNADS